MNRLATLTALSARLDSTLNEFALTANAEGEYPWQTAQRERRNRRIAGTAVGAAAIGAGAYGAKKAHGAVMNRAADAAQGPVRARDAYGAMAQQGMDKVKAGAQRVQDYGKNVAGKFKSLRSGASAGLGMGRRGALMGALKHVKFSQSDQIIALEAKMDGVLAEFGFGLSAGMKMLQPKPSLMAPKASVGVLNPKAESALLVPKVSVGVSKPKSPSLPTKKRKFWGGRDVTDNPNFG